MAGSKVFDVVFDITQSKAPDIHMTLFGIELGCMIALVLLLARRKRWWLGLAFAAAWAVFLGGDIFLGFNSMRSAVASGRCERVEGVVKDYAPEPYTGHAAGDLFTVEGHRFEVSNFRIAPGYGRSVPYGGIQLNGRYVRICAVDGAIGRLEVRREAWPVVLSEVSFLIVHGNIVDFSKQLYAATQAAQVRNHRAVWAKDYALSDFQLAVAGPCEGAIEALSPLVEQAARGLPDSNAMIADYRSSARCGPSPNPPTASWRLPEPVRSYVTDTSSGMVRVSRSERSF